MLIQQQTPRAAAAPQAPSTPLLPGLAGAPTTPEEVQALRIKLDDLKDALQDAASRRRTISEQLRSADSRAMPGLEERLNVLDRRIIQIENDITNTGLLLRSAPPAAMVAGTRQSPDPNLIAGRLADEIVPIVAIITVFFLAPLAIAIARLIWKRATAPARPPAVDQGTQQRLEQLQQSVDTIAIEVERISEGQRFVTKLLNERERAAIGGGSGTERR